MKYLYAVAVATLTLCGCTAITVRPIDKSVQLKHVCIQENTKVQVSDFLTVVQAGFDRHGISTEIVSGNVPGNCEYLLTYTALRHWDVSTFLSHAELRIERAGRQVGYAEYHLKNNGGLSLNKWASTKSKMDPAVDQLLSAYK